MNITLAILPRILSEFILDFFYFPLWWYTTGAKRVLLFCGSLIAEANLYTSPGLWLKNIFVPMYGQYDWQGRIMSVFMRLINVIGRSVGLLVWIGLIIILFFSYLFFPALIIFGLIYAL